MSKFKSDNPFLNIRPSLADLCNLDQVKGAESIKPEHQPLLIDIEAVRDRNAPSTAPQTATRYCLALPGSGFMRIAVKVEESTPSITQELLEKYGGAVRVNVEGFSSGVILMKDGGVLPYFKATKIVPIVNK